MPKLLKENLPPEELRKAVVLRLKGSIRFSGAGEVAVSRDTIEAAIRLLSDQTMIESPQEGIA